jgi:hypothetical protein
MSQPVSYTGKTMTYNGTTPITAETQKILKEFHGYTNEQAAKYYPIGSMVNEVPSPDLVAEFEAAGYSPPDYDVLMSISKSGVGLAGSAENFVQNSIGVTLDSLGQLATTFSYAKLLTNSAGWTEGAIEDTWLNKLGTSMSQIGQDFETDDYRLGVETLNANMSKAIAEAEGIGGTIKAIWGAASSAPGTFITEYIVSEIIQELPALLASGGASALVSGGFKLAGKELVESLATRGGIALSVGAVSDLTESYGGAAQSAYDEAYSTYMSVQTNALLGQGFSKEEATQKTSGAAKKYATDLAVAAGNVGALMGMVSMGLGGQALEKAIFGVKKAPEGFAASMEALYKKSGLNEFIDLGGVVLKEGFSEALEELVTNDFIEGRLSLIDQDRPRTESNTAAALLGFMAGGPTAGAIYTGSKVAGIIESTGNSVANVQLLSNPDVTKLITNPPVSTSNATSSELLTSALKTYGIDNVDTIDSLTNTALGTAYTSKQEVKDAIKLANPTITFSDSFIADATKALGGEKSDSEIDRIIESYINPRYITREEVKKAAAEEGITLTDEQADEYVGEGDQDTVIDEVIETNDPLATTQEEARQFFNDLGFTPTDEQVAQFVGATSEEEQKAAIAEFVDPRYTDSGEAKALLTELGYNPTDEEVTKFVGQVEETQSKTAVGEYVDPRQVTEEEARQYFTDLGYTPTDEQVAQFVAQVEETTQQDVISKYVDPRQVTRDELQAIANEEGLTLTDALAAAYVGQGEAENFATETLDTARKEYDPLATTQSEAEAFFASTGYTATPAEIAAFVASKAEDVQTSAIGAYVDPRQITADEAKEFLSSIGYNPTEEEIAQFTGQLNDDTYQVTQKTAIDEYVDPRYVDAGEVRAAYEELGLVDVTQEDVDRFVGQYMEEDQLGAVREYIPTATFNVIKSLMGSPSIADNPDTDADESKDATGIYKLIEDSENAGATRDEALQAGIDALGGELGLTRDELLAEIGLTKEELTTKIDTVSEDVAGVTEDVAGLTEDVAGLGTQISDVETNLDTKIGDVETNLTDKITGVEETLGTDIQTVADFVGKPAREVTQADIDFVIDLIAQENVSAELIAQYDVTGDGIVDINDQTMLETALQGGDVTLAATSMFDPATGLYLQQEQDTQALLDEQARIAEELRIQQELDTQTVLDQNTELNTQLNTQIKTNAQQKSLRDFLDAGQMGAFEGGGYSATTPDPVGEITPYDWQTIFRDQEQAGRYASPYASYGTTRANPTNPANLSTRPLPSAAGFAAGGQVEDINAMLLKLLGDT